MSFSRKKPRRTDRRLEDKLTAILTALQDDPDYAEANAVRRIEVLEDMLDIMCER